MGARLLACGAVAMLTVAGTTLPTYAVPPNPTDQQLANARKAKDEAAWTVGHLLAMIATAKSELLRLNAAAQLAEQKYAFAIQRLQDAQAQAALAQKQSQQAQKQLDAARTALQQFIRNSYISPTANAGSGGLLTASDPNAVLQRGDYLRYVSDHHLDVLSQMDTATIAKSNADARAQQLVQLQTKLKADAQSAFQAAKAARDAQQQHASQLASQQASYEAQLTAAQTQLATLNGQRAAFVAYQAEQARIAAEKARQAELARERAAQLAAQQAAANAAAAAANNGGGGVVVSNPPSSNGGWTLSKGQGAVARAMQALGMPYAWAGGGYNGPTYGVNSPGTDGWNDSTVYGYDCSGLTMYGWASQGLYLPHYAASQFSVAGSYHPSPGDFQPGDLLFWGLPGQSDIHHVAMYIGGGNVIQAPYSGTVVQITPWDQVSGDYFGATRPLT